MNKNIGYHTRLISDNTQRVVGGSFGGEFSQETIERLVNIHFEIRIKPSGNAVFVDKMGREVSLYFTVDPLSTEKGKKAKKEWNNQQRLEHEKEEEKAKMVQDLLDQYSSDELLQILQNKA